MSASRTIFRSFKSKGLSISADATRALESVLSREEDFDGTLQRILAELKDRIEKQDVRSTIVNEATILSIVADLSSSEEDIAQESLQLFDAFSSPKLCFDENLKSFKVVSTPKYSILGTADSRAQMFRERLLLTQQRLLRSELFVLRGMSSNTISGASVGADGSGDVHELSTIESLLGSTGVKVLFGMLTQPEEGVWFLEDLSSIIRLDLSRALSYHVFFTEGSQVVVQGELVNDIFQVQVLGMPPAEERDFTLKALGLIDTFGTNTRPQQQLYLTEMEAAASDQAIVIMSEVQLDKPLVLEKLEAILGGFEANGSEPLYILMGSFVSRPVNRTQGGNEIMQAAFTALADIILKFPGQAANARFLLIPGPIDSGSNIALPRRPIPAQLTKSLTDRVAHVTFASNPCRVRFFTQEIVIFREDLLKKMQRHLAVPLQVGDGSASSRGGAGAGGGYTLEAKDEDEAVADISEQLVESVLDQAHLCPLPMHARPILWELDYVMRLVPLPHLLVLADHSEHFAHTYKSCQAVNPGTFSSDFSFVVYQPATKTAQFSRIP